MARIAEAVIFDMDGVLINSEPLWRRAMIAGFASYGMPATEEECRATMGMRFGEVILLWLKKFGKDPRLQPEVEKKVVDHLLSLIESEGKALPGAEELLDFCRTEKISCGLATSSSVRLMNAVLDKLSFRQRFHAVVSAETLPYGKPHPEVFIRCAAALNVPPAHCVVIEDSLNGVVAAKAASMEVIAVPDDEHLKADERTIKQFALADHRAEGLHEALQILKSNYALRAAAGGTLSSRI